MKLYGHPFSGSTRRVQMLCEECGIPYRYEMVDLMKGAQHAPDFLALNPNGVVPVIVDDGFVLWESQAIMRYLANKHGAETWYPTEPKARARIDAWLDWNHTRLGVEVEKIAINTLILGDKGDQQKIEEGKTRLEKVLPVLEGGLSAQPYVCGSQPTLADLAAAPNFAYLEMCQYDMGTYPAISAWYDSMKSRNSFAATAPK